MNLWPSPGEMTFFFYIRCTLFPPQLILTLAQYYPPRTFIHEAQQWPRGGKNTFSLWGLDIDFLTCPVPKKNTQPLFLCVYVKAQVASQKTQ